MSTKNSNLNGKSPFDAVFKRNYDYTTASGWKNILQWMDNNVRTGYLAENVEPDGNIQLVLSNEHGDIYINGNSIANIVDRINAIEIKLSGTD